MYEGAPARMEPEDSIKEALEPFLAEDMAWIVTRDETGVLVLPVQEDDEAKRSVLQRTHTRLYGALLAANQRISDAFGCGLMTFGLLTVALPCLVIHLRLLHGFFPDPDAQRVLDGVRAWWAYGILAVIGLTAWMKVSEWMEGAVYQTERGPLHELMLGSGIDSAEVIGWAEGDDGLSTLAKHLKRDTQLR